MSCESSVGMVVNPLGGTVNFSVLNALGGIPALMVKNDLKIGMGTATPRCMTDIYYANSSQTGLWVQNPTGDGNTTIIAGQDQQTISTQVYITGSRGGIIYNGRTYTELAAREAYQIKDSTILTAGGVRWLKYRFRQLSWKNSFLCWRTLFDSRENENFWFGSHH